MISESTLAFVIAINVLLDILILVLAFVVASK